MSEIQLLGLTGFARAGKSEVLKHAVDRYGLTRVSPSDIIRQRLIEEHGEQDFSRADMRAMGQMLRQLEGPDFAVKRVRSFGAERPVLDGLRNMTAYRTFAEMGGHMIGLVARPDIRFERALDADDNKQPPVSVEAMLADEAHEMNSLDRNGMHILPILWQLDPDHIIDTSDMSKEQVGHRVDEIFDSIGIQPLVSL